MRWCGSSPGSIFATLLLLYLAAVKAVPGYSAAEQDAPEIGHELPATFAPIHSGIANELPTKLVELLHKEISYELPQRLEERYHEIDDGLTLRFADLQPPEAGGELPARVAPPPTSCWMFQHMVKSGGSTVRAMMSAWAVTENIKRE